MTPYGNEIIGEYKYGFRRNRSTVYRMLNIRKILKKMDNTIMRFVCYSFLSFFLKKPTAPEKENPVRDPNYILYKKVKLIKAFVYGTQNKVRKGNFLFLKFSQ